MIKECQACGQSNLLEAKAGKEYQERVVEGEVVVCAG